MVSIDTISRYELLDSTKLTHAIDLEYYSDWKKISTQIATVEVLRTYKGIIKGSKIILQSSITNSPCRYSRFAINKEYIIYAGAFKVYSNYIGNPAGKSIEEMQISEEILTQNNIYTTSRCSRTTTYYEEESKRIDKVLGIDAFNRSLKKLHLKSIIEALPTVNDSVFFINAQRKPNIDTFRRIQKTEYFDIYQDSAIVHRLNSASTEVIYPISQKWTLSWDDYFIGKVNWCKNYHCILIFQEDVNMRFRDYRIMLNIYDRQYDLVGQHRLAFLKSESVPINGHTLEIRESKINNGNLQTRNMYQHFFHENKVPANNLRFWTTVSPVCEKNSKPSILSNTKYKFYLDKVSKNEIQSLIIEHMINYGQ